ncbi:MAG: Fe-S cluster assembly protein NifU [Azoarcus sp.]|jgi:NifU-like protein|nr:Fe-S cluster assembly protein NifU [Azoarcus sp.]
MWDYSETVKDHFYNPRNAGPMPNANAVGEVGSISCGDALRLMLKVDGASDTILDASFQTFGCGSAIASSSALTEMIKGKTIDEALHVSNQDIADFLGGLPPEKMHCSVMGREALHAAVANYRGDAWKDEHEEGELVCKCFAVDSVTIANTIRANGLCSVQQVTNYTKAGGGCSACHEKIEEILAKVLTERGEDFKPASASPPPEKKPPGKLSTLERIRRIEQVIAHVRPNLQRDGGDIDLVDVDDKTIYVTTKGACAGCHMEAATLGGVQAQLVEALGELVRVVPVRATARLSPETLPA